jgi:hypothetical protein
MIQPLLEDDYSSDPNLTKSYEPSRPQKTIVIITDRTDNLTFASFDPRQIQKIQVSNEFPQKNTQKEPEEQAHRISTFKQDLNINTI